MAPLEQMGERQHLAAVHLKAGKLHACSSLLFQTRSEAMLIRDPKWTLPEVLEHTDTVLSEADQVGTQLRHRSGSVVRQLAGLVEAEQYEAAITAHQEFRLDPHDGFSVHLQDYLWHMINEDLAAAEGSLSNAGAEGIDVDMLQQIVQAQRQEVHTRHATIAQQVKSLVDASELRYDLRPARQGRAMVWDFTKDVIEGAYQMLPDELRATSRDGFLTMFCIRKREHIQIGTYSISGQPALQERMEIAVIYWPAKVTYVYGGEPASWRTVKHVPEYGTSIHIKNWIEGLPEDPATAMVRTPIHSLEELRSRLREKNEADDRRLAPTPVSAKATYVSSRPSQPSVAVMPAVTKPVAVRAEPISPRIAIEEKFAGREAGETRDFTSHALWFAWCPAGTFTMGSPVGELGRDRDEQPMDVKLSNGVWMTQTEITQKQWTAVMSTTPWEGKLYAATDPDLPAIYICHSGSPDSADEFCRRLTEADRKMDRIPAAWSYRLPTEAEWEHACRAGSPTAFAYGNDESQLDLYAWYTRNTWSKSSRLAQPVGTRQANLWGLFDMHGNVREWCSDTYQNEQSGGRDPAPSTGRYRVFRGGGWNDSATHCRSAERRGALSSERSYQLGFRVVLARSL